MKLIFLSLALLSGCAKAPYYTKPAPGLPIEARRMVYRAHQAEFSFWEGFTIGGIRPPGFAPPSRQFADYARGSGDAASADEAGKSELYNWIGLAAGLGGLAAGYAIVSNNPDQGYLLGFVPVALGGIGVELVVIEFGRARHLKPAVSSFNSYLKRDLGLDGGPP